MQNTVGVLRVFKAKNGYPFQLTGLYPGQQLDKEVDRMPLKDEVTRRIKSVGMVLNKLLAQELFNTLSHNNTFTQIQYQGLQQLIGGLQDDGLQFDPKTKSKRPSTEALSKQYFGIGGEGINFESLHSLIHKEPIKGDNPLTKNLCRAYWSFLQTYSLVTFPARKPLHFLSIGLQSNLKPSIQS